MIPLRKFSPEDYLAHEGFGWNPFEGHWILLEVICVRDGVLLEQKQTSEKEKERHHELVGRGRKKNGLKSIRQRNCWLWSNNSATAVLWVNYKSFSRLTITPPEQSISLPSTGCLKVPMGLDSSLLSNAITRKPVRHHPHRKKRRRRRDVIA